MRLAAMLLLAILACPAPGQAQAYRASVLWTAPDSALGGASSPDSTATGAPTPPDTARVFHAPAVPAFDPKAGEPVILAPILGSLICGGALGYGGALIGNESDKVHGYNYDDLPAGAILGYFIGETVGVPIGAHIGNRGRGNLAGDLGISILGHIAALGLASLGGEAGYIAGLSVQIVATTINEQKTGRRRALARHQREQAAEAAKSP